MVTQTEWTILKRGGCRICGAREPNVVLMKAHLQARSKRGSHIFPLCERDHVRYDRGLLTEEELYWLRITPEEYERLVPTNTRGPVGVKSSNQLIPSLAEYRRLFLSR